MWWSEEFSDTLSVSKCKLKDIPKPHLYRLYCNHHYCGVGVVQQW
jgi:hypothetical protein